MSMQRDFSIVEPFEICAPAQQRVPFVFNSPHSGRYYPPEFLASSRLNSHDIRASEDCYVDELFAGTVSLGAPMLRAHFPRAYLDVNREPYELDPRMFSEALPPFVNSRSMRVAGGLGTIAKIVGEGRDIYHQRMPVSEAIGRIETLYKPYHQLLGDLLVKTQREFGYCVLIDCHSMPSGLPSVFSKQNVAIRLQSEQQVENNIDTETEESVNRQFGKGEMERPDFIIGDRFGRSCSETVSWAAINILQNMGYNVAYNKPYAGGYITEHYGRPQHGYHALQIEVNRSLYMDEVTLTRLPGFEGICRDMTQFMADLMALPDQAFLQQSEAAE